MAVIGMEQDSEGVILARAHDEQNQTDAWRLAAARFAGAATHPSTLPSLLFSSLEKIVFISYNN